MAEDEITAEPKTKVIQPKKTLTRREFLKLGWDVIKYGALTTTGKFFLDLHKYMLGDMAMLTRCLAAGPKETRHLWDTELKGSYDEALLVVHPGYGLLRAPDRFQDKSGYREYINNLKQTIETSRQEKNLVIFLVGAEDVRTGKSLEGLNFTDSDLAIATNSDNPAPVACIETPGHDFIYQKITFPVDLNSLLKEKSVKNIKIAGEFRNACVAMAQNFVEGGGFKVELLEDALYSPSEK